MSEKLELSSESINALVSKYHYSDHFVTIVEPRLRSLLHIKDVLPETAQLEWTIVYAPVNKGGNCVQLSLIDPRKKFHFSYVIPLLHKFELNLFLGDNTFNFFEAHPLLIEKEVIQESDYKIAATLNTLPHLKLASATRSFDRVLLEAKESPSIEAIKDCQIYRAISQAHLQFTTPLYKIINGEWMLTQ
ncbi:MAG: hypothetical protein JEZ14_12155 [Marinilabiliaceae bacterium]|nr:hypothetical protein [Marinilabiliaceae bacterium]